MEKLGLISNWIKRRELKRFAEKKEAEWAHYADEAEREFDRTWELLEKAKRPPFYDAPSLDMDPYPYQNKEYVTTADMAYDRESGEVYEESRNYYADSDAKKAVVSDIRHLESMLDGGDLGIPSLPDLTTNTRRIKALDDLVAEIPENYIELQVNPLTPTGRTPKYTVSIYFNSYAANTVNMSGSHGTISYLASGKIGKARADYWHDHVHIHVEYKLYGDELGVSFIQYREGPNSDPVILYHK